MEKYKSPSPRPFLLYRYSRDGSYLYLRVPDEDTESDSVLTFNRLMADLGYPDPTLIWNKRLGVAVVNPETKINEGGRLHTINMLTELGKFFRLLEISDADWYGKRF